uniref:Uncharacterized protein n=1 Tax=Knipowitschia caucasica TaxID=637954 RepID=A0AAV2KEG9_KNICA
MAGCWPLFAAVPGQSVSMGLVAMRFVFHVPMRCSGSGRGLSLIDGEVPGDPRAVCHVVRRLARRWVESGVEVVDVSNVVLWVGCSCGRSRCLVGVARNVLGSVVDGPLGGVETQLRWDAAALRRNCVGTQLRWDATAFEKQRR